MSEAETMRPDCHTDKHESPQQTYGQKKSPDGMSGEDI